MSIAAVLGAAFLPAPAGAQQTIAPPGNSAIDEYFETVPSSSGSTPPGSTKPHLPKQVAKQLAAAGPDGRAAQTAIELSSPPPAVAQPGAAQGGQNGGTSTPAEHSAASSSAPAASGSPVSAVGRVLTGSSSDSGLGAWLPVLLCLSTLAFLGARFRRERPA